MDVNKNARASGLAFVGHAQNPIAETLLFPLQNKMKPAWFIK